MSTNTAKRGPGGTQPGAGGTVSNVRLNAANRKALRKAISREAYGKAEVERVVNEVVARWLTTRKG